MLVEYLAARAEELSLVEIDPDKVYPDYFPENNLWKDVKQ
jgi:hypothetical protein